MSQGSDVVFGAFYFLSYILYSLLVISLYACFIYLLICAIPFILTGAMLMGIIIGIIRG